MERRTFIQGAALIAASPLSAIADDALGNVKPEPAWTIGYRSVTTDSREADSVPIVGKIPEALRGTLYRNGPARHDRGSQRYHHWLDGDGMVQAYRVSDQGISHQAKYVHTDKYLAEEQAGRFTRMGYGTHFPDMEAPVNTDELNTANTSVLYLADELLALWEGGSAFRIQPGTLNTLGKKNWRSDLAGVPFSAHPKIEPDGTLWNFGAVGNANLLVLYRISAKGELQKAEAIPVPQLPMVHDFVVTEKHLVFLLHPFKVDPQKLAQGKSIGESYVWEPQKGLRVLTIAKDDWSKRRFYETESGFVYHFGNAWEDKQGVIRLSCMLAGDDILFQRGFDNMQGKYTYVPGARITLMKIDPNTGKVSVEQMPEDAEFPSIDSRHVGRHYQQLVNISRSPDKRTFGFDRVQRRNVETGSLDFYQYGAEFVLEEHLLVPDLSSGKEGAGWIVGSALDTKKQATVLSVFDAMALHNGPIAQAYLPYAMPMGIHGQFVRA
jgi:carotenoid cleavage dioxygenase